MQEQGADNRALPVSWRMFDRAKTPDKKAVIRQLIGCVQADSSRLHGVCNVSADREVVEPIVFFFGDRFTKVGAGGTALLQLAT